MDIDDDSDDDTYGTMPSTYGTMPSTQLDVFIRRIKKELPNANSTIKLVNEVFASSCSTRDVKKFLVVLGHYLQFIEPSTCDEITSRVYEHIYELEYIAQTQVDETTSVWSDFSKSRFTWCWNHTLSCLSVHVVGFCCACISFLHTRPALIIFGSRIEDTEFQVFWVFKSIGYLISLWALTLFLRHLYRILTSDRWWTDISQRWATILSFLVWGVYRVFFPTIAVLCDVEGFDDLSSFMMLLSAAVSVAAGLGVFFITDDFGITACMLTVSLTVVAKLTENRIAQAVTTVIIGACDSLIAPFVRGLAQCWFQRSHRSCPGLHRRSDLTELEKKHMYEKRRKDFRNQRKHGIEKIERYLSRLGGVVDGTVDGVKQGVQFAASSVGELRRGIVGRGRQLVQFVEEHCHEYSFWRGSSEELP